MEFMTHLFRFFIFFVSSFFSSDFTDESEAFLLIGLLMEFRGTLAAGQWLAPYMLLLFFVTQISQMTQIFLRVDYFVPQISQIYTDFSSWGLFRPTDFTDIHRFFFVRIILSHRFHRYTQIFLCGTCSNSSGYLHRPDRSPLRKSVSNRLRRIPSNKLRIIR